MNKNTPNQATGQLHRPQGALMQRTWSGQKHVNDASGAQDAAGSDPLAWRDDGALCFPGDDALIVPLGSAEHAAALDAVARTAAADAAAQAGTAQLSSTGAVAGDAAAMHAGTGMLGAAGSTGAGAAGHGAAVAAGAGTAGATGAAGTAGAAGAAAGNPWAFIPTAVAAAVVGQHIGHDVLGHDSRTAASPSQSLRPGNDGIAQQKPGTATPGNPSGSQDGNTQPDGSNTLPAQRLATQYVENNGELRSVGKMFAQSLEETGARYIVLQKIGVSHGAGDDASSTSGLYLRHADGSATKLQAGSVLSQLDFDNVFWRADDNAGGEIRFSAANARGQALSTVAQQILTIEELPPAPTYDGQTHEQIVAFNSLTAVDTKPFLGTDSAHKPAFVRIDRIESTDNKSAGDLRLASNDPQQGAASQLEMVHDGDIIPVADLSRLRWHAGTDQVGGTIHFTPLAENGQAWSSIGTQKLSIHESPRAPAYGDTGPLMGSIHDTPSYVPLGVLQGSDEQRAPAFVRIEKITPTNQTAGEEKALMLQASDGTTTAVQEGQTIPAADFDRLVWNTAANDGGKFSFMPLDSSKHPIAGVKPQTVTVHESPVPPAYTGDAENVSVPHDAVHSLNTNIFTGSKPAQAPHHIYIEEIKAAGAAGGHEKEGLFLRKEDGTLHALHEGDTVEAKDFGRLVWDATHNDGGSFTFRPLDAGGFPIAKPDETLASRTVQINEQPAAQNASGRSWDPVQLTELFSTSGSETADVLHAHGAHSTHGTHGTHGTQTTQHAQAYHAAPAMQDTSALYAAPVIHTLLDELHTAAHLA